MSDGLINEYLKKLSDTETPNLILASIFRALFEKDMTKKDWPQLGRLIKIYGRWRVLESFLRASNNANFDAGNNVWGYFNAICISLLEEEKANNSSIFKAQKDKEETLKLIESLKNRPAHIKVRNKEWLTSHRD